MGPADESAELLRLLANEAGLKVFAALVLEAHVSSEIADRAGLGVRDTIKELARLEAAGLAARVGDGWHACPEALAQAAAELGKEPDDSFADRDPAEAAVLRTYLARGRVRRLPVQRAKRLVVLDHVAGSFEPGVRYEEDEIVETLRTFMDDHAALRRHLVDEGFLGHEGGVYWRTGGSFTV
jgi:hypothetical protein